jgi:hypothetical protein
LSVALQLTVLCSSTDAHGNTATASFHVTIRDTTPPVVTVPANITKEATGPGGAVVSYSASATDAVGVTSFSCVPASGSLFGLGTTTVTCTAKDAAGNTGTGSFTVTVVDTTPPTIMGANNITTSTGNPAGTTVNFSVTATDLVDGPVAVSCSPASGSTFPIGTTTVNCSATDSHGNTATASFTVTVNLAADTTPPVISNLPANQTLEATGPGGAQFTFSITVQDPDDAGTFQCTGGPVTPFPFPAVPSISYTVTAPLGTTTIVCNATDSHGNTAVAQSFMITVRDTTPPVIGPVSNITVNATSPAGATVSYAAPTATDLVDVSDPVSCTPASGSAFPNGATTVTCTATDAHGNTATKTFTVTVLSATDQLNALKAAVSAAPELQGRQNRAVRTLLLSDLKAAAGRKTSAACAGLSKFISDVQANTAPGGPITTADSAAWVAAANAIKPARGC